MTKSKQSLVNMDQLSLFDLLKAEKEERAVNAPGRFCVSARLMIAVRHDLKQAPKSRESLADEMSLLTGADITVSMINNWTAESHPHRIPAEYVPAFCEATGSHETLRILNETAGVYMVKGPDALRADMQKDVELKRDIEKKIRQKEALIKELEGAH
jgi:hypothetical protein